MAGFSDAQHVQVLQGRKACFFQEQVGEVRDRQVYLLGYFGKGKFAVDIFLHESNGEVGGIDMPFFVFVLYIFSHIFHEPQKVEKACSGIHDVVVTEPVVERIVYLFEEAQLSLHRFVARSRYVRGYVEPFAEKCSHVAFEVQPIDTPRVVFEASIGMGFVFGKDEKLVLGYVIPFLSQIIPAFSPDTVNKYIFCRLVGSAFTIVIRRRGVEPDVGDVKHFSQWVLLYFFYYERGYYNRSLTLESFAYFGHDRRSLVRFLQR